MISFVSLWLVLPLLMSNNAMAFSPPTRANQHDRVATRVFVGEAPRVSPTFVLSSSSSTAAAGAMNVPEGASSSSSPHLVNNNNNKYEQHRRDWIDRSVTYYSKVMREERQRSTGQWKYDEQQDMEEFVLLAKKHYFAIRKVKDGKFTQAEVIYRKIIHDILNTPEDEHCDHAKLAVTTLLLALLTKRMGDPKKTRSVFLHFFRVAVVQRNDNNDHTECACSAKVLQAYALFEMQQGNPLKSLEIVQQALQFDKTLAPVLQWKQFRDARAAYKKYAKQRATVTKTTITSNSNTQVAP